MVPQFFCLPNLKYCRCIVFSLTVWQFWIPFVPLDVQPVARRLYAAQNGCERSPTQNRKCPENILRFCVCVCVWLCVIMNLMSGPRKLSFQCGLEMPKDWIPLQVMSHEFDLFRFCTATFFHVARVQNEPPPDVTHQYLGCFQLEAILASGSRETFAPHLTTQGDLNEEPCPSKWAAAPFLISL